MTVFLKDPDATIDYMVDWGSGYLEPGETIQSSGWSVKPTGEIVLGVASLSGTAAKVFVSGGVAGKVYQLGNQIVTTGGRTDERSLVIRVVQE